MTHWQQGTRRRDGWDEVPRSMVSGQGVGRAGLRADDPLSLLYDEAMAKFDAFCFWYARPARSRAGMKEVAKRLEAYGSPEALRIAEDVRAVLDEG